MALYYGAPDLAEPAYMRYGSPPPPPVELPSLDYLRVPVGITLQPLWARQYNFDTFKSDCLTALTKFPLQGAIRSLEHPLLDTHGQCTIGLYFTAPKANGNPVVEDQWMNIHTWVSATIDLYLAYSTTGFAMDFASGIQVTAFQHQVVNIDPKRVRKTRWVLESLKYIIDDTLSGNRGRGRARGPNRGRASSSGLVPSATTVLATPVLSDIGATTTSSLFGGFTDPDQLVASWTGQSPLTVADCKAAIFEAAMVTWFFSHAGLFFEKPYVFSYGPCALGLYLTTPASGRPPFISGIDANVEVMMLALLMHTVLDHHVPGYANLPDGIQIVFWNWQYLDPLKQCWKTKKISLQRCLNILVMRKSRALSSASMSSTTMSALLAITDSESSSSMPAEHVVTIAAVLPSTTGDQTGAQTILPEAGLAQSLAGLGIN
ncbi:hypothetical protein MMC26_000472 [Xylographa opegraphella]|nr:hypothetical protein [Xylographa opegraphella]